SIEVDVAAGADTDAAREVIARVMAESPDLQGRAEPHVLVKKPDDRTVRLEGRYWCNPRRVNRGLVHEILTESVVRALDGAGIRAAAVPPRRDEARKETARDEREEEEKGRFDETPATIPPEQP
ncbi:MAG: hypothetical protein ACRD68_19040, partial [Pyrinomonadaceae bacterium]